MKPIIGVPLRYEHSNEGKPILYISECVRRTLQKAGAIVYPIAPVQDVNYIDTKIDEFRRLSESEKNLIEENLNQCDGIFFQGGYKFTPYDRYLLERIIEKGIPVLGVCLGMQMMSCYKEDIIIELNDSNSNHRQDDDDKLSHRVKINKNSKLYKILGVEEFKVNSFHRRHATKNHIYKTVGYSSDGLIEAIEYPSDIFNIGVQWHPEISYRFDDNSKKIIDYFINEAKKHKVIKMNNKEEVIKNS